MAIERRALLVLGMHRSGTSALTRVLNIYGAALPAHLLPANEGNTAGYWESSVFVEFHEELLAAVGSRWDSPVWLSLDSPLAGIFDEQVAKLAGLIESEFGDALLIVVKDPRLCRLIPLWCAALSQLQIQPMAAFIVRHPIEVAGSIRRRDGMPEKAALLLWLQYVLAAEQGSRQLSRAFLLYDELIANAPAVIDRVQTQLGLTLPRRGPAADADVVAFLQPSLRHQRISEADLRDHHDLGHWIDTAYAWCDRARGGTTTSDLVELDAIRDAFTQAERLFGPSLDWQLTWERQRAEYFSAEVTSLREGASVSLVDKERWQHQVEQLESRLAEATLVGAEVTSLREAAMVSLGNERQWQHQVEQLESRLAEASLVGSERLVQVRQLAMRLAAADTLSASLLEDVRRLEARLAASEVSGAALAAEIERIERTLLWRAGGWARRLQSRLSGGQ